MPITRSAKKALRASEKKHQFNLARREKVTKTVKAVKKFIVSGSKKEAVLALRLAQKALDKAVKGHTLNKNTASRRKSRLSKMIKAIK